MAKHNFMTAVRNGDIVQGDTRPSEVTTYRLSPDELVRYGPPAAAKQKGGGDNMAIKMSEREAINMRDTADRLAPVTLPAAKVAKQVTEGEWQKCVKDGCHRCSVCGRMEWYPGFSQYCPGCGAKMTPPKEASAHD